MSIPLVDFRGKLTHETDAVLEALHQATGRDRSEIVREVLQKWAEEKIHEASLIDIRLRREGLRGIAGGMSGSARDDEGAQGSARQTAAARARGGRAA
jgi:predicted DNA-binding protein